MYERIKNLTNVFLTSPSTEQWDAALAGKPVIEASKVEKDRKPNFSYTFINS
jgi:hypothetical protein